MHSGGESAGVPAEDKPAAGAPLSADLKQAAGASGPPRPARFSTGAPLAWRTGRTWLGLAIGLASLVLAVAGIDLQDVSVTLRSANPGWLAAALGVVMLSTVAKAVRWRLLFPPSRHTSPQIEQDPSSPMADQQPAQTPPAAPLSLGRLTSLWLAGASLNLALPAPRSGDIARAYLAGEAGGVSKSMVLGTIAGEKMLDMLMLAAFFLALATLVVLPPELAARQGPVVGLALLAVAILAVMLWQRERLLQLLRRLLAALPAQWNARLSGSVERAMEGLEALGLPRRAIALTAWSVAIWLLAALVNAFVFLSLGLPPSWVASLFVLVVLQAGVAIPSTPGKVGVFQVLCRWALAVFGFSATIGLAYGILLYLVAPVSQMVFGAVAFSLENWRLRRTSWENAAALEADARRGRV